MYLDICAPIGYTKVYDSSSDWSTVEKGGLVAAAA